MVFDRSVKGNLTIMLPNAVSTHATKLCNITLSQGIVTSEHSIASEICYNLKIQAAASTVTLNLLLLLEMEWRNILQWRYSMM